jgi:hypothetical protein
MKCPNCRKRAISFLASGIGRLWARYQCPHCGARLRASRRTIKAIVACVLPLPLYVWVGIKICEAYNISDDSTQDWVYMAMAGPTVLLIAFWEWRTGTYALREKGVQPGLGVDQTSQPKVKAGNA